ncbi:MAG: hypothetical protein IKW49_03150 [Opitutales bacterium]|nr:hypothetical protein [Opitutales bacterium]
MKFGNKLKYVACEIVACLSCVLALVGCVPNVEKCAAAAVEKHFKQRENTVVKCSEVYNICAVENSTGLYTGKALVKKNGVHLAYNIVIEMLGDKAIVKIDHGSRTELN